MSAPTKSDPLLERLQHAFGEKHIREALHDLMSQRFGNDPLDYLTEGAKDELVRALIYDHRVSRRYAAASRKHYREREMEKQNVI